jgi:DNA-binding transcriptional MerR regulator
MNMSEKLTIKQTHQLTGISAHALRYYEKVGLLKDIQRYPNGNRYYSSTNLEWIRILLLLRSTGMPIQKMLELSRLKDQGDASLGSRIAYFSA